MDNKDNHKKIIILITTAMEPCVITTNLSEVSPHYRSGNAENLDGSDELCYRVSGIRLNLQIEGSERQGNKPILGCCCDYFHWAVSGMLVKVQRFQFLQYLGNHVTAI